MSLFKDFTKNLGGIIADSALNGLVQGIRASEFTGRYGGVFGDERATYITDGGENVNESIEQGNSVDNVFSKSKICSIIFKLCFGFFSSEFNIGIGDS